MTRIFSLALACLFLNLTATEVTLHRVPDAGIQPQSAVDSQGVLHLIYYKGDPANGDIFYVQSKNAGATFSTPLKVNSQPGCAIALGNIRGAHLALGKNNRVHIAWMGSANAAPRGPKKEAPMLYTRLKDDGSAFEDQRNVITANYGLDGGGTVAADQNGNVYVFWHGGTNLKGEDERRVWVARSTDEGKTFAPEKSAFQGNTGACGCCGMGATADSNGNVFVLYRAAGEKVNRDMTLLASHDKGVTFDGRKLDAWNANMCPMSTASLNAAPAQTAIAWENKGQIYFERLASSPGAAPAPIPAPGAGQGRKHPAIATNTAGETLLAWAEGMSGWGKTGTLSWQLYDKSGAPLQKGTTPGIPKWSLITTAALPNGTFTIIY